MITNEKIAWYILDEIAVECASRKLHSLSYKAVEAMKLLDPPTPEECRELYAKRNK